jgi:hypothetical protein
LDMLYYIYSYIYSLGLCSTEILSNVVDEIFSGSIVEPLRRLLYSFHQPSLQSQIRYNRLAPP